ncbi:MAG: YbjN domain-containing protein [Gammaproteobacteria bacterium]|nr:YbjN domain-containing protein [Gammaproteobacteria bacterium]MBU1414925.1 YbjN domain-containing protein [Gammaproteobacteria bacterium]
MSNDLITPENLTKELLASVYDAAFLETSWDNEGDLRVKEKIACFVLPSERKDRIQLLSIFGFVPSATEAQRLQCVNNINRDYILLTATTGRNDTLQFKYELFVEGGITKKNLVLATRRFLSIPQSAIQDHGADIVQ